MYFFYDSHNFSVGMIYVEERNSIWYRIGTNAVVQYFDGTVNGTLLHYYHINFVVNIHVKNLGHILINDNFTWLVSLRVPLRNETVQYGTF